MYFTVFILTINSLRRSLCKGLNDVQYMTETSIPIYQF